MKRKYLAALTILFNHSETRISVLAALKIPINHRETKDIYCYNLQLTDGLSERMGLDRAEKKTENRIEWNIFREYTEFIHSWLENIP